MNNKVLILLALLTLAVVFSGCTQPKTEGADAAAGGDEPTALTEGAVNELPADITNDKLKELDEVSKDLEEISNINLGIEGAGELTNKAKSGTKAEVPQ
ncbi:MAG: hypothetical protein AABW72_00860 [archaeon]